MALWLQLSNRPERLAKQLVLHLREEHAAPLSRALDERVVIVNHLGMARWLKLELARQMGICASLRFPFPASWLWELHEELSGERPPDVDAFSRANMRWRLLGLLPDLISKPQLQPLRRWLDHGDTVTRRYELCDKLSEVYDSLLVYRPDLLQQWEDGRGTGYHSLLWTSLLRDTTQKHHRAKRLDSLKAILDWSSDPAACPRELMLFGISALPKPQLETFVSLSRHCDVRFLCLGTGQELSASNSLASYLGAQSAELQQQLLEYGARLLLEHDTFCNDHALGRMQNRLSGQAVKSVPKADDSLRIHVTHSPLRELQALREYLLERFDRDPSLNAGEVLVLMPDPAKMEWAIRATFSVADPAQHIPWRISDTSPNAEHDAAGWLRELLYLIGGRLSLLDVSHFLHHPITLERFSLSNDDIDALSNWLAQGGLRWGADSGHRQRLGLPVTEAGTWKATLDRLALALAMPSETEAFGALLPAGDAHSRRDLFDRLVEVAQLLLSGSVAVSEDRSLLAWSDLLLELYQAWFPESLAGSPADTLLLRTVADLRDTASESRCELPVPLSVLLRELPEDNGNRSSWLRGEVCFAGLQPMRHVPARVLCLLGLDQDTFPRRDTSNELMPETQRRPGERSRELEDRQILLESLLSVREHLLLSYIGKSTVDDSDLPPSSLISHIQDHLREWGESPMHVTSWPLQRVSSQHFHSGSAMARDRDAFSAAQVIQQRFVREPFLAAPLPELDEVHRRLDVLQRFLRDPLDLFLRLRCGIVLPQTSEHPPDEQSFELRGLDRWKLHNALLSRFLSGNAPYSLQAMSHAGALPVLPIADSLYHSGAQRMQHLVEDVSPLLHATPEFAPAGYCTIDLQFESWSLQGVIQGLSAKGFLHLQPGALRPHQLLQCWLKHVLLSNAFVEYHGLSASMMTPEGHASFRPLDNPTRSLQNLLRLAELGLSRPVFWPSDLLLKLSAALNKSGEEGFLTAISKVIETWNTENSPYHSTSATLLVWGDSPPWTQKEFLQHLRFGAECASDLVTHVEGVPL